MCDCGYENTKKAIAEFISNKGWGKYHKPSFLVPALMVECGELMNCCLWKTSGEIDEMFLFKGESTVSELADIAINLLSLIEFSKLDLNEIILNKIKHLNSKYDTLSYGEHRQLDEKYSSKPL
jgi:NTP pyrophosphatase (non-canonical NTP hydrolase)